MGVSLRHLTEHPGQGNACLQLYRGQPWTWPLYPGFLARGEGMCDAPVLPPRPWLLVPQSDQVAGRPEATACPKKQAPWASCGEVSVPHPLHTQQREWVFLIPLQPCVGWGLHSFSSHRSTWSPVQSPRRFRRPPIPLSHLPLMWLLHEIRQRLLLSPFPSCRPYPQEELMLAAGAV